jgi:hypothetical protein
MLEDKMNREDIIKMAREAGGGTTWWPLHTDTLELFAALVAAAERNQVASWMMAQGYATGHGDTTEDLLQELEWQIAENWTRGMVNGVEAEREACAKVCEHQPHWVACAAAIRARGQA